MKDTKRILEELVMRYRLHPDLCDIYVEGESDRRLVQWFLQANKNAAIVYGISDIDVPAQVLLDGGLRDNNRARVIFLARHLESMLGVQVRVVCIADADYDHFLEITHTEALLLITDYTSIEMYCFDAGRVQKALHLFGCKTGRSGGEVMATITPLLKKMFFIRVVNQLLAYELHWISVDRCCRLVGDTIDFDLVEFQNRYFNTRGLNEIQKQAFTSQLTKLENIACADDR